jgi:hypothetical protein
MGIKLGDISPAAALMGSKGALNDLFQKVPGLKDITKTPEEEAEEARSPIGVAYKKGGSVRGAGCAKRGVKKCKVY